MKSGIEPWEHIAVESYFPPVGTRETAWLNIMALPGFLWV